MSVCGAFVDHDVIVIGGVAGLAAATTAARAKAKVLLARFFISPR
jgi:thioredoxin reductase